MGLAEDLKDMIVTPLSIVAAIVVVYFCVHEYYESTKPPTPLISISTRGGNHFTITSNTDMKIVIGNGDKKPCALTYKGDTCSYNWYN